MLSYSFLPQSRSQYKRGKEMNKRSDRKQGILTNGADKDYRNLMETDRTLFFLFVCHSSTLHCKV